MKERVNEKIKFSNTKRLKIHGEIVAFIDKKTK